VEQDENDRFGTRVLNICSQDHSGDYIVATKDINEDFWLLSDGRKFDDIDVFEREED